MRIDEEAEIQGIRCKDTHNLFWGVYGFSLQMPIPPAWNEARARRVQRFWATARHVDFREMRRIKPHLDTIHQEHKAKVQGLIDEVMEQGRPEEETYYLANDPVGAKRSFITFYLKSEADTLAMMTRMPNRFTQVSRPPNATALEMMYEHAGRKVVVRQQGWYANDAHAPPGGYTFKVELSSCGQRYEMGEARKLREDIVHRVHNINFENSLFSEGTGMYLYLNSEDDLFLAKLALAQYIKQVTKCIITD